MPVERLAEDVRLMREAGVNFVRVGESTWANWEPADGVFEFAWIDRVLDAMHAAGIRVMVGTPTYAIPPWLVQAHPDIMVPALDGRRTGYGARQNFDVTHPEYVRRAERLVCVVVEHVRDHPAVIGYQVQNEAKGYGTASEHAQGLFRQRLREKFGTVAELNRRWLLTFWSQRLASFDEFIISPAWTNPCTLLEWRRFQQSLATATIRREAELVRELMRPGQFITENFDFWWRREQSTGPNPEVDHFLAAPALDAAGIDVYHDMQDAFDGHTIAFCGEWARSLLPGRNHLVLETNAQGKGLQFGQFPPHDGQLRQAAFAHVAHGARLVAYWPWHSIHAGNETYWKGILSHDLEPNRLYREMKRIAGEFAALGESLRGLQREAEVAILHSHDSQSALLDRPFSPQVSYADWLLQLHRGLFERSLDCDFITERETDLGRYRLIVVPCLYIADDAVLGRLVDYVRAGGHLVLGFKSGFCNPDAQVRACRMPGALREICGFSYQEFCNIPRLSLRPNAWPVSAAENWATDFMEYLQLEGAEALAWPDHPEFGKYPLVTRHRIGTGCVTYLGGVLSPALTGEILFAAAAAADVATAGGLWRWPVVHRALVNAAGETVHFLFNFSAQSQSVTLPARSETWAAPAGETVRAMGKVTLGAWDAQVFRGKSEPAVR